MKYLKLFNESNFQVPSVDDAKTVFTSIIQDFIDNQKSDFKFLIKCNEWWGAVDPDSDIKWINFSIKSDTKFGSEDIYPVIKKLFDWSKENGANLDKIELTSKYPGMINRPEDNSKRWIYEQTFIWKK